MVRRKKQRSRAKFTGQQMTAAGQEVKTNGTSLRVTAEMFNINFLTLRRYVLKERDNPDAKMVPNYAVRLVFEPQQDALLCSYIKPCSKMGFGLDTSKVRQLAYEMAVKNNITTPESWKINKSYPNPNPNVIDNRRTIIF
ncbi:complement component-related sushi domain-containing [Holotrichia oblita]|uniref:Complement component-related sushi domain-containing n=1 Tax=Holotrichia oblita TaxID=644536 RepID=A0ACB9TMY2_HOLOL|nr:complement component-related sushi domain-containing [Holotrichia oblita]